MFFDSARPGKEISDLVIDFDPLSFERKPIKKAEALDYFKQRGERTPYDIINAIDEVDGILDSRAVDKLILLNHTELQRLSEEHCHGQRVLELLEPLIKSLRQNGHLERLRVVDIGCGLGYVMRFLGHCQKKGALKDVELIGVDYNQTLVNEAKKLAAAEDLDCRFLIDNAFRLKEPAHIFISTGFLHHLDRESLRTCFTLHEGPQTKAFIHFDFQPGLFSIVGSLLFHMARFRERIARFDGVRSAARGHSAAHLIQASQNSVNDLKVTLYGRYFICKPIPRAFHTLVGLKNSVRASFEENLDSRNQRIDQWY